MLPVVAVAIVASGGCAAACESDAKKNFAMIREATENSFQREWGATYGEFSGCDSFDGPSVIVYLAKDAGSLVEISESMKVDRWELLPKGEMASYYADFVMKKEFSGQVLVATLRDSPYGKEVEVSVEH
ncbi:hypothetical protein ACFOSO_03585 [Planomonospora venezuelensis]